MSIGAQIQTIQTGSKWTVLSVDMNTRKHTNTQQNDQIIVVCSGTAGCCLGTTNQIVSNRTDGLFELDWLGPWWTRWMRFCTSLIDRDTSRQSGTTTNIDTGTGHWCWLTDTHHLRVCCKCMGHGYKKRRKKKLTHIHIFSHTHT